ncbi:hypothetical protein [Fructobacillus durionis]|uniref:Uncharacterized protein n=1 Tax=Fructobacillus durionis TaxID=283737 RepID=A0A1I1EGL0_9LACO|nr:hypothetical protein [Fructobacillus durionis]SFB85856.1 hypothetical protein SAMN05660453_0457 [Fructobacillus durionis]
MENQELITEVIRSIEPLFQKKPNVIYEVRLVNQPFAEQMNIFFEWGRIGHATISRQIKAVHHIGMDQVLTFKKELAKRLSIPIRVD